MHLYRLYHPFISHTYFSHSPARTSVNAGYRLQSDSKAVRDNERKLIEDGINFTEGVLMIEPF
jgi:hypothetical protein